MSKGVFVQGTADAYGYTDPTQTPPLQHGGDEEVPIGLGVGVFSSSREPHLILALPWSPHMGVYHKKNRQIVHPIWPSERIGVIIQTCYLSTFTGSLYIGACTHTCADPHFGAWQKPYFLIKRHKCFLLQTWRSVSSQGVALFRGYFASKKNSGFFGFSDVN